MTMALVGAPCAVNAQAAYPTKPIHMVVPFPPGGVSDASARMVGEQLSARLGQSIIIDNKPGATGNIGGQFTVLAAPDGYTILFAFNGLMTINPLTIPNMPFDTVKDFTPIGKVGDYPSIIAVNPSVKAKNLQELIALSKAQPGGLNYGTSGLGSNENLLGALLDQRTGANFVHVPYKGAGPALNDAIGGHVPISMSSLAGGMPHVKAGTLKAIAVSGSERSPALPDVPTIIESGVPDVVVVSWIGLVGPAKMPRAIVERLNTELNAVLAMPDLREKINALGVRITPGTPEAFAAEIKHDLERNGPVVKAAGIKMD